MVKQRSKHWSGTSFNQYITSVNSRENQVTEHTSLISLLHIRLSAIDLRSSSFSLSLFVFKPLIVMWSWCDRDQSQWSPFFLPSAGNRNNHLHLSILFTITTTHHLRDQKTSLCESLSLSFFCVSRSCEMNHLLNHTGNQTDKEIAETWSFPSLGRSCHRQSQSSFRFAFLSMFDLQRVPWVSLLSSSLSLRSSSISCFLFLFLLLTSRGVTKGGSRKRNPRRGKREKIATMTMKKMTTKRRMKKKKKKRTMKKTVSFVPIASNPQTRRSLRWDVPSNSSMIPVLLSSSFAGLKPWVSPFSFFFISFAFRVVVVHSFPCSQGPRRVWVGIPESVRNR